MRLTGWVLGALFLGLVLGAGAAASHSPIFLAIVFGAEPVGTLWTNAIRMTVIPLVVSLLIAGVIGAADVRRIGGIGGKAIVLFVGLLVAGGVLTAVVTVPVMNRLAIPPEVAASLRASVAAYTAAAPPVPSVVQRLLDMIPANPFQAAADGAMLPLIVFTLLFALALTRLDLPRREPIGRFFKTVGDAMLVMVGWVLAAAPVGIFGLALGLGARMGAAAAGALLYYVATLSGALLVIIALLYPLAKLFGVPLRKLARAAAPAQVVAFSSRSSLASLPPMITGARDRMGASETITGFALPFAVSVFRLNVPIAWVVGALFLGKLYGVALDPGALAGLIVTATLLSFSVPGIPSASLFLLAPVLVDLGLPPEGAGILIAVDAIPDMFKTTVNVTGHLVAAAILGRTEPRAPAPGVRAKSQNNMT